MKGLRVTVAPFSLHACRVLPTRWQQQRLRSIRTLSDVVRRRSHANVGRAALLHEDEFVIARHQESVTGVAVLDDDAPLALHELVAGEAPRR